MKQAILIGAALAGGLIVAFVIDRGAGRYQIQVIPGTGGEVLRLDTRSGEIMRCKGDRSDRYACPL